MTAVKALSVREPFASLIASGRKSIELRSWTTSYRGPLLICSGLRLHKEDVSRFASADELAAACARPRGTAVALVQLVDVRPATSRDARAACSEPNDGAFAWLLEDPQPVPPVPILGRLSLFDVDLSIFDPKTVARLRVADAARG